MSPGKLIVIDGSDASGKKTQTEILIKNLKERGQKVAKMDFPQYGKKSCGPVEEYLSGKYGDADEVGPYISSIFYAVDRYDASHEMKKLLAEGYIIIANRYVSSNKGHQGGKMANLMERERFLNWLDSLEYGTFDIPRPELVFFLHVPTDYSRKLIEGRGGARDIHEKNEKHLKNTEECFLYMINKYDNWHSIECIRDGQMRTREDIALQIWKYVETFLHVATI